MNGEIRKEIKEKAIQYAKENKAKDFLGLFFNVKERNENDLYLETWINGEIPVFGYIHKDSWRKEFKDYVKKWQENVLNASGYLFSERMKKNNTDFHNWLVAISNIIDEGNTHDEQEKPTECNYDIFVVTFDKGHYKKHDLENMTDKELYDIARKDHKRCHVHTAREYENKLNSFEPLEKYVWTYIIRLKEEDIVLN